MSLLAGILRWWAKTIPFFQPQLTTRDEVKYVVFVVVVESSLAWRSFIGPKAPGPVRHTPLESTKECSEARLTSRVDTLTDLERPLPEIP